jgi:hypothetical protein
VSFIDRAATRDAGLAPDALRARLIEVEPLAQRRATGASGSRRRGQPSARRGANDLI